MDGGTWQATVHGVARVRHDLATKPPHTHIPTHTHRVIQIDDLLGKYIHLLYPRKGVYISVRYITK